MRIAARLTMISLTLTERTPLPKGRGFTLPEAYEHWLRTRANTPLGGETIAILDSLWRLAFYRGCLSGEGTWINERKRED